MQTTQRPLVFGLVAGEVSGDTLGAGLIRVLKQQYPNARFVGICGSQMLAEGGETWFPMERLSVMGLVEVLGRIKELFAIRAELEQRFVTEKVDVFIGIDAPDFNIGLAAKLKAQGIKTVHYVSPSVWAWRQGRIHKIKAAIDLMLCLLPFEKQFYDQHQLEAVFVGHPLADSMPLQNDTQAARQQLQLSTNQPVIALLPGSRGGEVSRLAEPLFAAGLALQKKYPTAQFIIPAINRLRQQQIEALLVESGLQATVLTASSMGASVGRLVMAAADVVVLASGTATLEAMLLKKPMVVVYKLHWLTYLIVKLLSHARFISLPNLLANEALVPELVQQQASAENIARASQAWLEHPQHIQQLQQRFDDLHRLLQADGSVTAAKAILKLINNPMRTS
ncbi:lipid-A-disaccharide synthase [Agitococcus lubricus]|uniref:Lipid-A-disaccharide synthase n=1 Tax=Agitococcus lubricus TaxID=1077255 RepID=A0A2T5J1K2_9GAMM|nr:lipid-A-disaccharide synthase [Agitococcus lubricus]PTQ90320.1 lipid-A-disaccharide synthase [Agitococcus lubricus]